MRVSPDRTLGIMQDTSGNRSQKEAAEGSGSVSRQHDKIAAGAFGLRHDGVARVAALADGCHIPFMGDIAEVAAGKTPQAFPSQLVLSFELVPWHVQRRRDRGI